MNHTDGTPCAGQSCAWKNDVAAHLHEFIWQDYYCAACSLPVTNIRHLPTHLANAKALVQAKRNELDQANDDYLAAVRQLATLSDRLHELDRRSTV